MTGYKIKFLQSDGGGNYDGISSLLAVAGISMKISSPYAAEQNGLVGRHHRKIVEMGVSILAISFMPLKYWDKGFYASPLFLNRLPSSDLD